ncbi:MAG TPA: AbrB/MazE/SpoVT family DNA-binding domain-containing protein [Pseudonocardiaceae bacterium]|nr:AbrB/MazE/SpoVT family DNA-binding domain-containing protein [Pseudonocardiaceae bacterium]
MSRLDASGRVADRTITDALGWAPGDHLTLTADAQMIELCHDEDGLISLTARSLITLPAPARDRIGVHPGDRVLLVATPREHHLAVYPLSALHQAMTSWRGDRTLRTRTPTLWTLNDCCYPGWVYLPRICSPPRRHARPCRRSPNTSRSSPAQSVRAPAGCMAPIENNILDQWGERRLDEITPSEVRALREHVKTHVVARRNARGGRCAAEHLIAALRCIYRRAEDDGWITTQANPARKVDKPRRLPTTRHAIADTRLAEINQIAATTGNDPALDTLLLRLHTETDDGRLPHRLSIRDSEVPGAGQAGRGACRREDRRTGPRVRHAQPLGLLPVGNPFRPQQTEHEQQEQNHGTDHRRRSDPASGHGQ